MSSYSPGRDGGYDSDGSVDESQKSYDSQEDDSNHYAIQRHQPPGELILPLLSENRKLKAMNNKLMYKVYELKVIEKNLTSEIDELKDAFISLSVKNNELKYTNEELRASIIEENAKTSFKFGGYGVNLHLNRETGNKQRMKQKFREPPFGNGSDLVGGSVGDKNGGGLKVLSMVV
ncbi:hypothetical protein KSS87_021276 [Heliosperma pusillum]|nr:hypothetical protein KSS87_021276 [Heliosperma pusillum]